MRRLRAKLRSEHEQMIGTVRNIGYKLVWPRFGPQGLAACGDVDGDGEGDRVSHLKVAMGLRARPLPR